MKAPLPSRTGLETPPGCGVVWLALVACVCASMKFRCQVPTLILSIATSSTGNTIRILQNPSSTWLPSASAAPAAPTTPSPAFTTPLSPPKTPPLSAASQRSACVQPSLYFKGGLLTTSQVAVTFLASGFAGAILWYAPFAETCNTNKTNAHLAPSKQRDTVPSDDDHDRNGQGSGRGQLDVRYSGHRPAD